MRKFSVLIVALGISAITAHAAPRGSFPKPPKESKGEIALRRSIKGTSGSFRSTTQSEIALRRSIKGASGPHSLTPSEIALRNSIKGVAN